MLAILSLPTFPRQARHHLIYLRMLFFPQPGMLSVPFSHSKLLVFCATLTLKQASKKESLGITAPASSSHNLINVVYPETSEHVICNSHHMMVLYKFPNFLTYFLCWIRESPCFIYFSISSFHYQTQYQAYGCFSNCSRENEWMNLVRLGKYIHKIKRFNPFQFISTIFCSSNYTSNFI